MSSKSEINASYNENVNAQTTPSLTTITRTDIKVSYIDSELGLVTNVTLNDANIYARSHPRTTFIFVDGSNNIRYLNINQVNQLSENDLIETKECPGFQNPESCDVPPKVEFIGGEGIGAVANAVIGNDGSLLAIDLIDGGYGYQYAPQVQVTDICNIGSGAVVNVEIGNIVRVENICDYVIDEEYQIEESDETLYEKVYGPDGEDLGYWEPEKYTNINRNTLGYELNITQESEQEIKNPFWTTKTSNPLITDSSNLATYSSKYEVAYSSWNDYMNSYAISPVPPSTLSRTDGSGKLFIFEWEIDFPFNGEYVIRGLCEKLGKVYLDNAYLFDLSSSNEAIFPYVKTISAGVHKIRVDLRNYFGIPPRSIFNSVDYIQRANQQLERISPLSRNSFFIENGVESTLDEQFYRIVWNNVNFPLNGNYTIRVASESNATIYIQDLIISYEKSSTVTQQHDFSSGNYDVIVEFENSSSSSIALDVQYTEFIQSNASQSSWRDNPFAVALSIDAPQRPNLSAANISENREIGSNLIWTTRSPYSTDSWHSVIYNKDNAWSDFMNAYSISPVKIRDTIESSIYTNSWEITAPFNGYYGLRVLGSDSGRILIDGNEVAILEQSNTITPRINQIYLTRGFHTIDIEIASTQVQENWIEHPIGISATLIYCRKQVQGKGTITRVVILDPGNSYYSPGFASTTMAAEQVSIASTFTPIFVDSNQYNVSFGGTSFVVTLNDGGYPISIASSDGLNGTGYSIGSDSNGIPISYGDIPIEVGIGTTDIISLTEEGYPTTIGELNYINSLSSNGYPVIIQLADVIIRDGGLRYDSVVDEIRIIPDNGAQLSFDTGNFGAVTKVNVLNPGAGFTEYPRIFIRSKTGVNFSAIPVFEVIRDPVNLVGIATGNLLQVTDLVGVKKTGYIDGRAYYGSVYYQNGIKYAGQYQTPGQQIRVYDTLQESITGISVTPPSAIQRLGSDINSNNSSLNLP